MVRFSCFNSSIHFPKHKQPEQPSTNSMHKAELSHSQTRDLKDSNSFANTESKSVKDYHFTNNSLIDPSGKSVIKVEALGGVKKSLSQGSILDLGATVSDPQRIDAMSEAFHLSSYHESNESVFSICDQQESDKETDQIHCSPRLESDKETDQIHCSPRLESDKETDQIHCSPSVEPVNGSVKQIAKSPSMPDFGSSSPSFEQFALERNSLQQSKSYEDLKDMTTHDVELRETREQARDDFILKNEGDNLEVEDVLDENYDYFSGITKDWIIPAAADFQSHSCVVDRNDELPGQDFKVKRIEEWVSNLQHCSPPEETNDFLTPVDQGKGDSSITISRPSGKETKINAGAEFAKRYISSLSAASATAQLANHGLVVMPILAVFVSLKVLNLSGNSIEKITAGSLPRGLHVLNLSKNKISVIEGLRELTRLRVIDLSYNRIVRIGHGLSSCSSLKELYLAGNKISEVEGLHRLLKLTVLDLRFNKISTAKSLGQLAANYTSLQAIGMEGNPAQKNVGDEQLKKYLQSLLPHLAYYNRQDMKANTTKDMADRSVRLGISGPQIERGLRQDHKVPRKSVHALSSHKGSSAHAHHRSQASKPRQGRLPPSGTKVIATNADQYLDFSRKIQELKLESSMRRSRSEGTLGVF